MSHFLFYSGQRKVASLLLFLTLSLRSHGSFPGLCGPERYISTKYFISLMAFPNSFQVIAPDVAGLQAHVRVHSSTHILMNCL